MTAVTLAAIAGVTRSASAQALDSSFPVTDGEVLATAFQTGTSPKLYVGGDFSYVGRFTGGAGLVSATTGRAVTFPVFNGTVNAVASDGSGGWFVGGQFTCTESGLNAINLAHVTNQGALDTGWRPAVGPTNSSIRTLLVQGTTLFVGGDFTSIAGNTHNNLASMSTSTGTIVVNAWNPNVTGVVRCLGSDGNFLYAGGDLSAVGGNNRSHGAQFTLNNGSLTAWNPQFDAAINAFAIMVGNTDVFVGGEFTHVGNTSRSHLCKVGSDGTLKSYTANTNGTVFALATITDKVYVGGAFDSIVGTTRRGVAKVSDTGSPATLMQWSPGARKEDDTAAEVHALWVNTNDICVGGNFVKLGSDLARRTRIGCVGTSGTTDSATSWDPGTAPAEDALTPAMVLTAVNDGTNVCVGGTFTSIGGEHRTDLARIDLATDTIDSWNLNLDDTDGNSVNALALDGTQASLFVGGALTVGSHANLCRVSTSGTGSVDNWSVSPNAKVKALQVSGGALFLGGEFVQVGGTSRNFIAQVDTTSGALDNGFNPNCSNRVNAIFNDGGGSLFIGGDFATVGGVARNGLAKFDLASRTVVSNWDAQLAAGDQINCMTPTSNGLMIGGHFTAPNGTSNLGEASWSGGGLTSFRANDGQGNHDPNGTVFTIMRAADAQSVSHVWVGGQFDRIGLATRKCIAKLDDGGSTPGLVNAWTFGFTFDEIHGLTSTVMSLQVRDGTNIFFGGTWITVGGSPRGFLASAAQQ